MLNLIIIIGNVIVNNNAVASDSGVASGVNSGAVASVAARSGAGG